MSNLEELIERLCPDGVEYKTLGEICDIFTGGDLPKNCIKGSVSDKEHPYPVWGNGKEVYGFADKFKIAEDAVVISSIGANTGSVYFHKAFFTPIIRLKVILPKKDNILIRYIYHYLSNIKIKSKSSSVPNMNASEIKAIKLPVPPLEVQREIVRILDNFTFLTTELAAELAARQKQYEFYRDFLLNFNDGCEEEINGNVRLMKLGELGKWSGGKTPSMAEKSFWENGSIPWISSKDMKFNTLLDTQDHITQKALIEASMTLYPANSIAVVTRSGILKHTFPVAYIPFPTTINQDIKILVVNDEILPRYAFHVIQSKGKDILEKTKKQGGTVDSLDFQKVLAFKVLVPTKSIQQKLVDKLDRFDALCNDISSGLPAEIEMRQKQYEYYRDKLLTFKELKKEA